MSGGPVASHDVVVRGKRKARIGLVVSDKMQKTIVVRVERRVRHPVYQKVVRQFSKFKVHDEQQQARVGDLVKIIETRPISKEKRWRLAEILRRGLAVTEATRPAVPEEAVEESEKCKAKSEK